MQNIYFEDARHDCCPVEKPKSSEHNMTRSRPQSSIYEICICVVSCIDILPKNGLFLGGTLKYLGLKYLG